MSAEPQGATAALARFVASGAGPPDAVLATARQLWTDAIRPAGSGADDPLLASVDAVVDELLGRSPVAGNPEPAWPAPWQALRITLSGGERRPDRDATQRLGAPVVAAARAIAGTDADAEVVLDAIARGLEVSTRIEAVFDSARSPAPWGPATVATRFGVAATVGRLLKLDQPQLIHAFGLAGGQAGGLSSAAGTVNELIQLARAVFDGVEAGLLAQRGFTASEQIVEGVGGAGDVLFAVTDYDPITAGLGETWWSASLPAIRSSVPGRPAL